MYSWKLTSELDALVYPGAKSVVLALATGKKSDRKKALSTTIGDEAPMCVEILDNHFKLSFDREFNYLIKHPSFPTDDWYRVENIAYQDENENRGLYLKELYKIMSKVGSTNPEDLFEAKFSLDSPGRVGFTCEKVDDYSKCFDEMVRQLNCELYQKTKKWIPGHRYDSEDSTYIFLGAFTSRRNPMFNSEYLLDSSSLADSTAYLIIEESVPNGCKTVSDVLRTTTFGPDKGNILALSSMKLMVDSGEVLTNDVNDIQDLWPDMINLAIKNNVGSKYLYDILCYTTKGKDKYNIIPEMDQIKERLKSELFETAVMFWNIGVRVKESCRIGDGSEHNVQGLWDLYVTTFLTDDFNSKKIAYYRKLFEAINIDVDSICTDIVSNYSSDFIENFDNYLKYGKAYCRFRGMQSTTNKVLVLRKRLLGSISTDNSTLKTIYDGSPSLQMVISNLANQAIQSFGYGVSEFKFCNVGTKRSPIEFYSITITLDDILKSFKVGSEVPETLKSDIVKTKFLSVTIQVDKDKLVE